ncbi:MAG: arginine--tRNA ligase, partial [Firmicutes bacterium]|nr:arginine--tRNA ligase [Bacillota bacterium]
DGETGPYVQYTHARAASVLRNSGIDPAKLDPASIDFSYLVSDTAFELIKLLYRYPDVVVEAAEKYEPSVVTRHIVDIAQAFNKFYHDEHILTDNQAEKEAKLLLTAAAKQTLRNGLDLLGIKAPEKM